MKAKSITENKHLSQMICLIEKHILDLLLPKGLGTSC